MTKRAVIPPGCWPPRMLPEIAAAYVGERTVESFLSRVGREYPASEVDEGAGKGRRRLWLRRDLDRAIGISDDPDAAPLWSTSEAGAIWNFREFSGWAA